MLLEDICLLLNRNWVEYILYNICIVRFGLLSNVFLTQLGYICSKYQKSYIIIYQLLENLVLCPIYLILYKN